MRLKSLLGKTLLLACMLLMTEARWASADTISIRADAWPPYNGDPASETPGYGIEILKAIFSKGGHTIDYQTIPWTRALADVKSGKFDGAIGASTEDGAGCLFPKEPIGFMDTQVFAKKGSAWTYTGIDSLKSIKLGAIADYDYGMPELNKYIKEKAGTDAVQLMTGDDALEKNISKLQAGRIDVLVEAEAVVKWTLKKMGLPEDALIKAGSLGAPSEIYVVFAPTKPSSQGYADTYDKGIGELRSSGDLKKILDKYGIKDWK